MKITLLSKKDETHQRVALGYIDLGMWEDAKKELSQLSESCRKDSDCLILQLHVAKKQEDWISVVDWSEQLTKIHPDEPEWTILYAYATRRSQSIQKAQKILENALEKHPHEPVIHFNLGCYACQQGNLKKARSFLKDAFELDASYGKLALEDQDLVKIHKEIREMILQATKASPLNNLEN